MWSISKAGIIDTMGLIRVVGDCSKDGLPRLPLRLKWYYALAEESLELEECYLARHSETASDSSEILNGDDEQLTKNFVVELCCQ